MKRIKKIGLIGYGELALQIELFLRERNKGRAVFHFFDDLQFKKKTKNSHKFRDYILDEFSNYEFYVCLGYKHPGKKKQIIEELLSNGRKVPSFVHPTAYISPDAVIEDGVVIYPMCNIDKNSVIGKGTLLNNSVVISHDNKLGECCYVSPGVVSSGFVSIGDATFLGTMTAISNGVKIGSNCLIGIGSVVTKNIQSGKSAIGNPLRILKSDIKIL